MFSTLIDNIKNQVAFSIFKIKVLANMEAEQVMNNKQVIKESESGADEPTQFNKVEEVFKSDIREKMQEEIDQNKGNNDINHEKIGRNDPCPCGSGKKYKKCCGKDK
jgi:uncharacterized protein YecA (UPF0149 family)